MPFVTDEKKSAFNESNKFSAAIAFAFMQRNSRVFEIWKYSDKDCLDAFHFFIGDSLSDPRNNFPKIAPHLTTCALMSLLVRGNNGPTPLIRYAAYLIYAGAEVGIFDWLKIEDEKIEAIMFEAFCVDIPEVVAKLRNRVQFNEDRFTQYLRNRHHKDIPLIHCAVTYGGLELVKEALRVKADLSAVYASKRVLHILQASYSDQLSEEDEVNGLKEIISLLVVPAKVVPELKINGLPLNEGIDEIAPTNNPVEHSVKYNEIRVLRALLEVGLENNLALFNEKHTLLNLIRIYCEIDQYAFLIINTLLNHKPERHEQYRLMLQEQNPRLFLKLALHRGWNKTTSLLLGHFPQSFDNYMGDVLLYALQKTRNGPPKEMIIWDLMQCGSEYLASKKPKKVLQALEKFEMKTLIKPVSAEVCTMFSELQQWNKAQKQKEKESAAKKRKIEGPLAIKRAKAFHSLFYHSKKIENSLFQKLLTQADRIYHNTIVTCAYLAMAMQQSIDLINSRKPAQPSGISLIVDFVLKCKKPKPQPQKKSGSAWLIINIFKFLDFSMLAQLPSEEKAQNAAQAASDLKKENKTVRDFYQHPLILDNKERDKFLKTIVNPIALTCWSQRHGFLKPARMQLPPPARPPRETFKAKRKGKGH